MFVCVVVVGVRAWAARANGDEGPDASADAKWACAGGDVKEVVEVEAASWWGAAALAPEERRARRRAILVTLSMISVLMWEASASVA